MHSLVNGLDERPSRKQRAQATRQRILTAARAEFLDRGYVATRMAAVAERAGVSVQMLYLSFGTKPKLLGALVEAAVFGDEGVPPPESGWWARVQEAASASEMIHRLVIESGPVFRLASPLWLVAQVGATLDEDLAAMTREGDRLRARDYRRVVELAATKGTLKHGLDIDLATDILVALLSPTFYMELVKGRGWADDRALEWLADTLSTLLCETPSPD